MPLSYRDPLNRAVHVDGRWFRVARAQSVAALDEFGRTALHRDLVAKGGLPAFAAMPLDDPELRQGIERVLGRALDGEDSVFSVATARPVTYPWEWSDVRLAAAGEFLLDLRLQLLDIGCDLQDASAHNVVFCGGKPMLIDVGSIIRWDGEPTWIGFRQFVEHFINPLAISGSSAVSSADLWRMNPLTGMSSQAARCLMGRLQRLQPRLAMVQRYATPSDGEMPRRQQLTDVKLAKKVAIQQTLTLKKLLTGLRRSSLATSSTWGGYHQRGHYTAQQLEVKRTGTGLCTETSQTRRLLRGSWGQRHLHREPHLSKS